MKKNNLFNSFKCAFNGIKTVFFKERNFKIHTLAMILVIIFGFILKLSLFEWIICLICFALVMGLEMINTAIEKTVDLAEPNYNETAKLAKDIAAGAVFIVAIFSAIIGIIIFAPKLLTFISNILNNF